LMNIDETLSMMPRISCRSKHMPKPLLMKIAETGATKTIPKPKTVKMIREMSKTAKVIRGMNMTSMIKVRRKMTTTTMKVMMKPTKRRMVRKVRRKVATMKLMMNPMTAKVKKERSKMTKKMVMMKPMTAKVMVMILTEILLTMNPVKMGPMMKMKLVTMKLKMRPMITMKLTMMVYNFSVPCVKKRRRELHFRATGRK